MSSWMLLTGTWKMLGFSIGTSVFRLARLADMAALCRANFKTAQQGTAGAVGVVPVCARGAHMDRLNNLEKRNLNILIRKSSGNS